MKISKHRKKPVVVEAVQVPQLLDLDAPEEALAAVEELVAEITEWCGGEDPPMMAHERYILIHTLEGEHKAMPGDWIIKGVAGEFYPCKPEIFMETYEPA